MPPTYTGTFWKAECDAEKENALFLRAFSFLLSVYSFTSLYRQVISRGSILRCEPTRASLRFRGSPRDNREQRSASAPPSPASSPNTGSLHPKCPDNRPQKAGHRFQEPDPLFLLLQTVRAPEGITHTALHRCCSKILQNQKVPCAISHL